ncbi:hypothetical protein A2954_05860 [Candidatus Roizmanbacteria bacterium RIFCSPLOWO2_01_FULL_37_12]|uniref:histidine kinase n=1 Tax=Candidatus Roizmanbacteria bacterium RIFCSPLOWO2_01_FULL_37_12 TaxID=1802056 RepID=A0A1F7IBU7_9BACT|nr:MAG: hypothetical protein A2768_02600 [Candidatus Roizmanbacteria bacterium RIFCSPHIGHO2_01_FULL_37_16]OGK25994.1 MAG: hypothetical protein A3D76_03475 [Candidatus Roizmanbacteria bacterium RIFCSPHIGHO2_02_FULL_37_9b]OGK40831.1 MAG: hypothetical protein A2954_05860 [Candidatus Roizmanbacteria bacterium RIFCSPLOWO2_01_FULL_37_12]
MDKTSHVTEELYKKNLELAERNKTLSLLRKIDEIILSSVTDIDQIAHQIADAAVAGAGFKAVYIMLINKKEKLLIPQAVSLDKSTIEIDSSLIRAIYSLKVNLNDSDNLIIKTINERKLQKTDKMYDLFKSLLTEEACKKIQQSAAMKLFHIYPLVIRSEPIGAIIVCPKEQVEPFFVFQEDLIQRLPNVVSIAIDNALLYQKIDQANTRLKELDKLKDEFVSLASHELRTPLTAIKSYLWMVLNQSKNIDPQIRSYLDIASQETEHLIKLVQNMLTISKIESQRLELTLKNLDLYEMVKLAYDTLKINADEKHIIFTLLPYPEKLIVNGDKEKISEIFENIIGNAIKYTPENGTVSIHFTTEKNKVIIHVADSGPGIAKENMAKLFQKFSRLEEGKQNRTPGTGLGLYISKQIVELHKGSIKVESEAGKGTTFTVHLPLAQTNS